MILTPLSQLATVSAGQAAPKDDEFSDDGTPFVRAGSLDSLLSGKTEFDLELVSAETAKLRKLKTYPKGTILFAKSGMSATKDRIYVLQNPAHVVSHLATLIPNGNAHADYLRLALKRFPPSVLIKDPSYPAISLGDIQSYELPVPEQRDDQIRIAHLLGKVEGLITQRKQHLQQLDDLLKSVFLEMFGDPVRNEKGWEKKRLSKLLVNIESGTSPKCEARPTTGDEWGVLKLGAVTKCSYNDRENKALPEGVLPSIRDEVKSGDLLFSRKNTYELVAACAYVFSTRPRLLMPDLIFRLVFRDDANVSPIYMWKLLTAESQRRAIQSLAAGAAGSMPNISKANLREVEIPTPPPPLQERFVAIVNKVEYLKTVYQQSLTDLEGLYGALSQQAFKGELDLSRAPVPEEQIKVPTEEANATQPDEPETVQIELPDLPAEMSLSIERLREEALRYWFEAYWTSLPQGSVFKTSGLVDTINYRLTVMDDQDHEFDKHDHEILKTWVFEALKNGRLTQHYDDPANAVVLRRALAARTMN